MYRNRNDPRLRRTLDQLSHNIESANESAQEGIYTFSQNYIHPCFASISHCFQACTASCAGSREDRLRRRRGRGHGRAELNFDFYDDWEEDEDDGPFGWGNSEFDRLLAGSGGQSSSGQPGRQRAMSYGVRRSDGRYPAGRRKSAVQPHDGGPDPTIIPTSSYFGFLGRLPWKVGGQGLRYKPSAADLQEHPGTARRSLEEHPLIEESDEDLAYSGHRRNRSETAGSGHTTDSLSSRGDIFPSEDELDDAVPLDDEFAMGLERRNTGMGADDNSSGKTPRDKRPRGSRMSTRTVSSRSTRDSRRRSAMSSPTMDKRSEAGIQEVPTISDLKLEEEHVQKEEENDVERKRDAARVLAAKRGLQPAEVTSPSSEDKSPLASPKTKPMTEIRELSSPPPGRPLSPGTVPFPSFEPHPTSTVPVLEQIRPGRRAQSDTPQRKDSSTEGFVPAKLPNFQSRPD